MKDMNEENKSDVVFTLKADGNAGPSDHFIKYLDRMSDICQCTGHAKKTNSSDDENFKKLNKVIGA